MKIKESKNLRYTKMPFDYFELAERVEPAKCILENFNTHNDRLELEFKNGTIAFIEGRNPHGGLEIDRIEEKLPNFVGRSYEEILNANF